MAVSFTEILTLVEMVGPASVAPILAVITSAVTEVEAIKGQTSAQKLAAAQAIIHQSLNTIPALAKLPTAKIEGVINEVVALAQMFIK